MKMEDLKYTIGGLVVAVDSYFYDDFIYFWKGENRLGFILMEVRESLLSTMQKKYDQFGYSNR